jgi:hypothetical protein
VRDRGPQELKGNIRVYCRVRPALEEEQAAETVDLSVAAGPERSTLTVAGPSASGLGESRGGAPSRRREAAVHPFEFDQVQIYMQ